MEPTQTIRSADPGRDGLGEPEEPGHFQNEDFDHQLSAIDPPGHESSRMDRVASAIARLRGRSDPKLALISAAPVFAGLSTFELRHLAGCLDEVAIPGKGYVLIREGRVNRTFWLLLEGGVSVTFAGRPMRSHGPGEILGVPSLLDRKPAGVTVSTMGPIRALVASLQQFEVIRGLPAIDLQLRAGVSERIRADYLRLADLRRRAS